MNKSELFKAAHQLVKAVIKAGDNYRVTFGACIKAVKEGFVKPVMSIADLVLSVGGKVWEQHGFKRIYMTVAQFNTVTGNQYTLNDAKNKIFYDFAANAILRSYNGKKPQVEVQY
ncbi:hypothetical protein [Acinetobacter sp. CFCC 10889]|uniref:hypothetical protein n=1 Tax=Acinetobacter sp. CFCC 10889 TaxID=1775557 RepID=UPI000DD0165B|nr:hypothetical protein [Acinetobacter sp. CFCC 10889]